MLYLSVILAFDSVAPSTTQIGPKVEGLQTSTRLMYVIPNKEQDSIATYDLPKLMYRDNGDVRYAPDTPKDDGNFTIHALGLWVETTWNEIVFGQPTLSVNLTAIEFNKANAVVGNLIWAYEFSVNVFFWAIIFVLARALVRRVVQHAE